MEEATKALGFAPSALWITIGVLVSLATVALLVINLIIKIRELRKPKVSDEKSIQDKLHNDNERLNELEATTKRQDEELKLILRSQMAMIHHMVDGNNTMKLKEAQEDIEDYLISGKIKNREV